MKKELCLFSAPNKLLKTFKLKNLILDLMKSEKKRFKKNVKITGWIVNPGQSFKINTEIFLFSKFEDIDNPSTGTNHIDLNCCKKKNKSFLIIRWWKNLNQIRASSEFTFLLILNSLRRLDKQLMKW